MIDNSSAFRMDPNTPLVVPEVNAGDLARHNGVVANPNCTAAILAVAVWPIHQAAGVKRIIVSTYQSASGAGAAAMAELEDQVGEIAAGKPVTKKVFPHQIAFNVFSHNTKVAENGYNEEENKVVEETRKMFHSPDLPIQPTCIRVPVLRAHSEAITLELDRPLSPAEAKKILEKAPGVKVVDDAAANHFPMPLEASGDLDVHVGRIRKDLSNPNGLVMWVAGDQLLKGAAWNAVQIAEALLARVGDEEERAPRGDGAVVERLRDCENGRESPAIVREPRPEPARAVLAHVRVHAGVERDVEVRGHDQRVWRRAGPPAEDVPLRVDRHVLQPDASELPGQSHRTNALVERRRGHFGNRHLQREVPLVVRLQIVQRLRHRGAALLRQHQRRHHHQESSESCDAHTGLPATAHG